MAAEAENAAPATADAVVESRKEEELPNEVRNLVSLLSKLNPMAEEFFPSSYHGGQGQRSLPEDDGTAGEFSDGNFYYRRRRYNNNKWRRRYNGRAPRGQRDMTIRRTVYVSELAQDVTEETLAAAFTCCGPVVDCRICGDPNSNLRFAFVEFSDEEAARVALSFSGSMLGPYPVKVLPSKTAILPVNPGFLPRSEDEREMCARTVYCTNIDRKLSQIEVKQFFEDTCGVVSRLRLLGDHMHKTRIAFVEFYRAECAILALNRSGSVLGSLPIRVSPSKTPVRPRDHMEPSNGYFA